MVVIRQSRRRWEDAYEWTEFDGLSSTVKTLGGFGNLEDNVLYFPDGSFRALALRSFCMKSDTWSIWWLDARNPTTLDVPVVGKFSNHIGVFFADDLLDGQAIEVRFTWTATPGGKSPLGSGFFQGPRQNMGNELDDGFRARRTGNGSHSALKAETANGGERPGAVVEAKPE